MEWTVDWQIEAGGRSCLCGTAGSGGDSSAARRLLHDGRLASRDQDMADVDGQLKRLAEFEAARIIGRSFANAPKLDPCNGTKECS